ncbi:hypothetical protein HYC85_002452 [Camellia sinensis]|uniref:AB hydrolase-1 domain-containing protein n=1 Tax=Camellia sinensis TaxID=4442 RepID=A0A7J7I8B2_CAMSI|nr:hypothetical protein HYC85_002452 [Camellia sinensis]
MFFTISHHFSQFLTYLTIQTSERVFYSRFFGFDDSLIHCRLRLWRFGHNIFVMSETCTSPPLYLYVTEFVNEMDKMVRLMDKRESHFVLVHGSCHGAWCWYKVATLLRSGGHRVTVLDLAASGVHPKQVEEVRSMSDYLEPLMEFMVSLQVDNRVILVGHSMGGIGISVAMERFPDKISVAVFVAAFMPGPDLDFLTVFQEHVKGLDSFMDCQHKFDNGLDKPPTSLIFGPKFLSSKLYNLSTPEKCLRALIRTTTNDVAVGPTATVDVKVDNLLYANRKGVGAVTVKQCRFHDAVAAPTRLEIGTEDLTLATLLVRPYPIYHDEGEVLKETALTKDNYGSVRRVYVVIEEDNIIKEKYQRWMIENNPMDEVKVIPGSDHMVMISKPQELCSCLQEIAGTYS